MQLPGWLNRTNIYYFGLALMIIAVPLSKFLMSVAQFILVFNWLFDVRILDKFKAFFKNQAAVVIVSIYLMHVVGLLWTSDFHYAAKDLRIKLPILALPIILSTSPPVSRRLFYHGMVLFIAANVVGSFFSINELLTKHIRDIRDVSIFISHIRFSLNICLAIFSAGYLAISVRYGSRPVQWLIGLAALWLLVFLVIIESVTGLAILLITSGILLFVYVLTSKSKSLRVAGWAVLIIVPLALFLQLRSIYLDFLPDRPFVHDDLEQYTSRGNPYIHDTTFKGVENGHWTGQYIQPEELKESWNARSSISYDSIDRAGHLLRYTLIRYLTSKGLRKDAEGVNALSEADIRAIESGVANADHLTESSLTTRIKTIIWEIETYRRSGYLSGHSVAQRLEFLRAAMRIIAENPLTGTGTGDIRNAFSREYVEMNSQLEEAYRWKTHNQYITIFATFGAAGLIWLLFALIYPAWKKRMFGDYFYMVFFCILMLSMLTEDTFETQAGATFYAFFTGFLLLTREQRDIFPERATQNS